MRNRMLVSLLYSFGGYGFVILSLSIGISIFNQYAGVIIGLCLMVLAIVLHMIGSTIKPFYVLSYILNSIGVGFSISTYYTYFHKPVSLEDMFLCAGIGIITVLVYQVILSTKTINASLIGFTIILVGLLYSTTIFLWVQHSEPIYSILFFLQHVALFIIIGLAVSHKSPKETLKMLSFASFGELLIVGSTVLIIVSEGELLEGLGEGIGDIFTGGGKRKKNNI